MYNAGIILGALLLAPAWGVYGLAWGVVLGAFMHMGIQLPLAFKLGYRYKPVIDLKSKYIRKIGRMMIPRTLTLGISQLNLLVITIIASTLAGGSVTVFNFANNLHYFPVGVFGISFAIAAFPSMSGVAFNKKRLISSFSGTVRQILFFIVPSTVFLLTLRAQIVRVIFGAGKFDWEDTILTIDTLSFFAVGMFAHAIIPLLIRVFYARHNSRTPFFIGMFAVIVNIVGALYFSNSMGVAGLGLAFSIAGIIHFMLLWIAIHLELGGMDEVRILISTIKFSAAAVMAGFTVQLAKLAIWPFIDMSRFWGVFTQATVAGICGLVMYLLMCFLLRSEEFYGFLAMIRRRIPWKKVKAGDQGEARGI